MWHVVMRVMLSALAGASGSRGVVLVMLVPPGPGWAGFVRSPQAGAPRVAAAAAEAAGAREAIHMHMRAPKRHAVARVRSMHSRASARWQKVSRLAPWQGFAGHEHRCTMGFPLFVAARSVAAATGVARTRASCGASWARAAARFGMCSRMLVECVLSISIKVKTRFLQHHDFSAGPWPSWRLQGFRGALARDGVLEWRGCSGPRGVCEPAGRGRAGLRGECGGGAEHEHVHAHLGYVDKSFSMPSYHGTCYVSTVA